MSRIRRGRYNVGGGKREGTPTVNPPRPQAIDDYSGFKIPHDKLKKDWQGLYTASPDIRNPQDYLRGIKDDMRLPNPRPEAPDVFVAGPLLFEDGVTFIGAQDGVDLIYSEGVLPTAAEL